MNVLSARARLSKLRSMTFGEVADRARYATVVALERAQHRRGRLAPGDRLERALRADLRRRDWRERLLEARQTRKRSFFPGTSARDAMRQLFAARYEGEQRDTAVQAERARNHQFEFFGRQFHYGSRIDWQADPVTGRGWPAKYHADIPVHGGDAGFGDVKYVWELNRQQYLIDLAKSWFLLENRDDLQAVERLVRSWIAGNPYATGVNWACALEPAFRVWSWLWAYHLTANAIEDGFHIEWLCGFYDHGRFLARHLELYSSPYNHLIGEASALFALGLCFPEFRESAEWIRRGSALLRRRLPNQFYPDGGSVEQSTFYHHATAGFYLLACVLGRANGIGLSSEIWRAVERALDFSMQLTAPDGRIPEIGGADDGKPIRMEHLRFWDFRPYLAAGAVLFERPDFKFVAGRFYEDALWLLGPGGLRAFDALPASQPQNTSVLFASSGYAVDRSEWSERADYVVVDVGEQAAGMRTDGVPNSMHGHADCLSVILSLAGRRVLVDSGLFAYNCGGEWEGHFRETAAHNTARIDGRDQARHIGKMAWSHSYRAAIEGYFSDGRQGWTLGSHDGYARGLDGVTHRRAVWRRPGGYIVVLDEFAGSGQHELEVNWQFAPGALDLTADHRATFDDLVEIAWLASSGWSSETRSGGGGPADGWICESLGVRRPAPRLVLRSTMTGSSAYLLTVFGRAGGTMPRISVSDEHGCFMVTGEDYVDWIAAAGLTKANAIATDAVLGICRIAGRAVLERMQIGGTYFNIDVDALLRRGGQVLCAQ
jgi:hypothetical protein